MKWRGSLFSKYFVLFVGLVAGALILNGAFDLYFFDRENRAALAVVQREKAQAAAQQVEQFVREIERQIGWTTHPTWPMMPLEQRQFDFARLLKQVPAITELTSIDAQGREQLRVSRLAINVIGSNADRSKDSSYVNAVANRLYFSPIDFRRESEPHLTMAVAGIGKTPTVTLADVNLKLILDVVAGIRVGNAGYAYVVDRNGRLIAHPDIALVLRNTDLSGAAQVIAARRDGGQQAVALPAPVDNILGEKVLAAYAPIPALGWYAFVELPENEARQPVYDAATRTAILLLFGILIAVLAAALLARRMVVPIRAMQAGAARIGTGELNHRLTIKTGDELEGLADRFNTMAGQLQESYSGLERKVDARTSELREALDYQTATSDVLKVMGRLNVDLTPVLQTVVTTAARLCQAERAFIFLHKDGKYHLAAANQADPAFVDFLKQNPIAPDRGTTTGRVALERRTIHINDISSDPEYTMQESKSIGHQRTSLGVPLLREETVIGAIILTRSVVRPFAQRQIDLVTTFADQAVIAIENARLFEAVQARTADLTEALARQTATSEVLTVIGKSTADAQPVFESIVEAAARLCHAESATITQIGADGAFVPAAAFGVDASVREYQLTHKVTPGRGSIGGRAVLERRPVHVVDVLEDPEFTQFERRKIYGFRTALGVPLLRDGVPIGVIFLYRTIVQPFSDKQIELVSTFADQAVIAIENARLFVAVQARTRDLTEALERQTATSEVLTVISRSTSKLQPVLDTIVNTAARLCLAESALIWRVAPDGNLHAAAMFGVGPEGVEYQRSHPIELERGTIVGRTVLDGKTVHVADVMADPDYTAFERQRAIGYRTSLGVPLLRDGMAIGALFLYRRTVRPFTDKQIDLVSTFADQAVIAIENVRLFEEVQARTQELSQSVAELSALGKVGQAVNSSLDLETVLPTILVHACEMSDSGGGAVYVYNDANGFFELAAGHGMSDQLIAAARELRPRIGDTIVGRCAAEKAAVQVADLTQEDRYPLLDLLYQAGVRAILAVPLIHQDRVVGVLIVRRKRTGLFAPRSIEVLQAFATQSALAILNARLFQEIKAQSRQLEIASQHKSQFLANMSHELRTPLNAILGYTEMMVDGLYGAMGDKARNVLERVQSNGKHLLGLINDVLDLSKIEAGQLKLAIDDYRLDDVVRAAVAATESLAGAKGLALRAVIAPSLPAGRGDSRRLTQVFLNLVGNAIKFTDKGSVEIRADAHDGIFEVAVVDTGPGIAPADQARIFDEFQQIDTSSTRKKGGTGLGLSISRRFIEMHGGRIAVESTLGSGSTFKVIWPTISEPSGAVP